MLRAVPTMSPFPLSPAGAFPSPLLPLPAPGRGRAAALGPTLRSGLADFAHHSRRWCMPLLSVAIDKGAASIPSPTPGAILSPGLPFP